MNIQTLIVSLQLISMTAAPGVFVWSPGMRSADVPWRNGLTVQVCGRHDNARDYLVNIRDLKGVTITGDCENPGVLFAAGRIFDQWETTTIEGVYRPLAKPGGSIGQAYEQNHGPLVRQRHRLTTATPPGSYFYDGGGRFEYKPRQSPQTVLAEGATIITVNNVKNLTIENLRLMNGSRGIRLINSSKAMIRGLSIHNINGTGIEINGASHDGVIRDSTIADGQNGIYAITVGGDSGQNGWRVEGNHIARMNGHSDSHCIGWQGGDGNVFEANRLEDCNTGITWYTIGSATARNNAIRNNSAARMLLKPGRTQVATGFEWTSANRIDPTRISGNVIEDNHVAMADKRGFYIKVGDNAMPDVPAVIVRRNSASEVPVGFAYRPLRKDGDWAVFYGNEGSFRQLPPVR